MEEVLAIEESDGPLRGRLGRHGLTLKKQNPAGGPAADPAGSKFFYYLYLSTAKCQSLFVIPFFRNRAIGLGTGEGPGS
jgi:hypothetical protein